MKNDRQAGGRSAAQDGKDTRRERLKLALRENLKRRKSQAREKSDFKDDITPASPFSDDVAGERDEESPG